MVVAEQRDGLVAIRDVDENLRLQLDTLERRAIVAQRDLVLGAAIDEFEQPFRQALLRHDTQIVDVERILHIVAEHWLPLIFSAIRASALKHEGFPELPVEAASTSTKLRLAMARPLFRCGSSSTVIRMRDQKSLSPRQRKVKEHMGTEIR